MKKVSKILAVLMALSMLLGLVGCGGARDEIVIVQREAGSGTRDAFESLFNLKNLVKGKVIMSSTGNLKTAVSEDKMAIGYVSLGSVDSSVKAVKVDGVIASEENILNKTYKANRPFNMISKKGETLSAAAQDFLKFVYSSDGQAIVSGAKLIMAQTTDGATGVAYDTPENSVSKDTIVLSGSTSMEEVIHSLAERYSKKQTNVTFSSSFGGSSAGKKDVEEGTAQLGLVSSALGESDNNKFIGHKIAIDGLAIVVNKDNNITELLTEQIAKIFKGEISHWSELEK